MRGSKRLAQAIASGKVVVRSIISGETNLQLRTEDNEQITIIIGPYAEEELAPKYVPAKVLKTSRNLHRNLETRKLQVIS